MPLSRALLARVISCRTCAQRRMNLLTFLSPLEALPVPVSARVRPLSSRVIPRFQVSSPALNPPRSPPRQAAPLSESDFLHLSLSMLRRVHSGLQDMKEANDVFDLRLEEPSRLSLALAPDVGGYELSADLPSRRLLLFSPSSGLHRYHWTADEEQWVDDGDAHLMIELLVRELLLVCRGMPNL
jgi:frataxin-like iron-binding protein CyaY